MVLGGVVGQLVAVLAARRCVLDRRVNHGVHALDGAMFVLLLHALTVRRILVLSKVALQGDVAASRLSIIVLVSNGLVWEEVPSLEAFRDLKGLRRAALDVRRVELDVPVYRLIGNVV